MENKIDDRKNLILSSISIVLFIVMEAIVIYALHITFKGVSNMEDMANNTLYVMLIATALLVYIAKDMGPNLISDSITEIKESYRRLSLNYRKTKAKKSMKK